MTAAVLTRIPWQAGLVVVGAMLVLLVAGLLVEWQRRKTLTEVTGRAIGGSLVVYTDGHGGPITLIQVGSSPPIASQGEADGS